MYLINKQDNIILKETDKDISDILKSDLNKGFSLMVERYSSRLYWHIRRLVILHEDADDALQNTFINAWKNIGSFRNESSIFTWLYAIATNQALSTVNIRKRNKLVSFDNLENIFANSREGDTWFDGNDAELKLQNAILRLPDKQRIVFNMRYFDDLSYDEMSTILKTSVGALKASYYHAVKKIEEYLKDS
jgi:RNA polymerase sigma-70 factor (ECF subfamily)